MRRDEFKVARRRRTDGAGGRIEAVAIGEFGSSFVGIEMTWDAPGDALVYAPDASAMGAGKTLRAPGLLRAEKRAPAIAPICRS